MFGGSGEMKTMRRLASLTILAAAVSPALAAEKPFDPGRDAAADLQAAMSRAKAERKNILLDVGGNWCPWCLLLERTIASDAELHAESEKNYVLLHVNFSRENENRELLARYPKAQGYPAWYVLSPEGRLLKAEDTSELEATHKIDAGYNKAALRTFLADNGPKSGPK